jgi:large subunit ribosomal protein L5
VKDSGEAWYQVKLVYQTVEQLRSITPLTLENPPAEYTLRFEGVNADEDGMIPEKDLLAVLDGAIADMRTITGQQPMVCRAKKSIAGFHIREGMAIGCKVTLRGDRMWEFMDRLLSTALPRVRDFRGISRKSFDGRGNYSLGITEQLIFPEIDYDKIDKVRGMDIVFVTTAQNDEEARELLSLMGAPFEK